MPSKADGRVKNSAEVFMGIALVLAAMTTPEGANGGVEPMKARCSDFYNPSPLYLAYAASASRDPVFVPLDDDEEEEEKLRLRAQNDSLSLDPHVVTSEEASENSGSPSPTPEPEVAVATVVSASRLAAATVLQGDVLRNVLSFSTAGDLTAARATSRQFLDATSSFISYHNPSGCMFIRWTGAAALMRLQSRPHVGSTRPQTSPMWECSACQWHTPYSRSVCSNDNCRSARQQDDNVKRAFVGQLRKEKTVEFVNWMVSMLCPEVTLLHVENHTSKEGRGKGCAWVYTNTLDDHVSLLKLSKRVYCDGDVPHNEGIYVCRNGDEDAMKTLDDFARMRSNAPARQRNILPKKALVVEVPKTELPNNMGCAHDGMTEYPYSDDASYQATHHGRYAQHHPLECNYPQYGQPEYHHYHQYDQQPHQLYQQHDDFDYKPIYGHVYPAYTSRSQSGYSRGYAGHQQQEWAHQPYSSYAHSYQPGYIAPTNQNVSYDYPYPPQPGTLLSYSSYPSAPMTYAMVQMPQPSHA